MCEYHEPHDERRELIDAAIAAGVHPLIAPGAVAEVELGRWEDAQVHVICDYPTSRRNEETT